MKQQREENKIKSPAFKKVFLHQAISAAHLARTSFLINCLLPEVSFAK